MEAAQKKAAVKQAASSGKGANGGRSAAANRVPTKGVRQTMPDPLGRRIEPVVDPELAKKATAAAKDSRKSPKKNSADDPNYGRVVNLSFIQFCC